MKGNNEIKFCTSQMIEMIQYYFDNILFKEKVKVCGMQERIENSAPTYCVSICDFDSEIVKSESGNGEIILTPIK